MVANATLIPTPLFLLFFFYRHMSDEILLSEDTHGFLYFFLLVLLSCVETKQESMTFLYLTS